MTDPDLSGAGARPSAPPPPETSPPRLLPRWMKVLIIVSFALNLLFVGALGGFAMRSVSSKSLGHTEARSLGFGPWTGAFDRADRRALLSAYRASGESIPARWREDAQDRRVLLETLRREPFDLAELDAVTERLNARNLARLELGERLVRDHIAAMSPQARRAFADRLERAARRGPPRSSDRPPRP